MNNESLNKRINKLLNEEETFLLSLLLLVQMHEDKDYKELSNLVFLFDNYDGFKQFIKFYGGTTIDVPTIKEVKQALKLLELFQKVYIDKKDFDESYNDLKLATLDLTKQYCQDELDIFINYLQNNDAVTLRQLRKFTKKTKKSKENNQGDQDEIKTSL